jgi:hypothetical protein
MALAIYGPSGSSRECKYIPGKNGETGKNIAVLTVFLFILLLWLLPSAAGANTSEYVITIPCRLGEPAYITNYDGSILRLGKVLDIPGSMRWPSYTASKWASPGSVCASAVNAIHVLHSIEQDRGRTFSILPGKTFAPAAGKGNAFIIDNMAGEDLFGSFAPVVGSLVFIEDEKGNRKELSVEEFKDPRNYLKIHVPLCQNTFLMDIENRPGGRIMIWDGNGVSRIATVVRPLGGVGRFGGTQFQELGRIRANHTGVIDISTSEYGHIGGFQVIPISHAFSTEMVNSWLLTQWMIISPLAGKPPLTGRAPLFSGHLVPGTRGKGKGLTDIWWTYGRKPLVLCRLKGGKWQKLPSVTGRKDKALQYVTHLRVYFPGVREPLKGYK